MSYMVRAYYLKMLIFDLPKRKLNSPLLEIFCLLVPVLCTFESYHLTFKARITHVTPH